MDIRRQDLIAYGLAVVGIACGLALLFACVPVSGEVSWRDEYNADWAAACACWGYTPPMRPGVRERDDCITHKSGTRYFATSDSPTGYATGIFYPSLNLVEWCDIRALKHEFSHAVRLAKMGDAGMNHGGECWL